MMAKWLTDAGNALAALGVVAICASSPTAAAAGKVAGHALNSTFVKHHRSAGAQQGRRQESTQSRLKSLVLPFPKSDVTSKFGLRFNPILKAHIFHRGVDFGAALGAPVRAAQDGVVEASGDSPGAGLRVRISHGDNVETCYEHLSNLAPGTRPGKVVHAGEIIGTVGKSGWATGPNLHYEVLVNGNQVDPLQMTSPRSPIQMARYP
jgi:murein DD-endopeptidase MepM/ murein hydrolase activator NlpD